MGSPGPGTSVRRWSVGEWTGCLPPLARNPHCAPPRAIHSARGAFDAGSATAQSPVLKKMKWCNVQVLLE